MENIITFGIYYGNVLKQQVHMIVSHNLVSELTSMLQNYK